MEVKSKVKDGYLVMMFPIEGMSKEDIRDLKEEMETSYRMMRGIIRARRVINEGDKRA